MYIKLFKCGDGKKHFFKLAVGHFIPPGCWREFSCLHIQLMKVQQALLVLQLKIYFVL